MGTEQEFGAWAACLCWCVCSFLRVLHQACCSVFLFSSLPPWPELLLLSSFNHNKHRRPPLQTTHTRAHTHSLPNVTTACLSFITTFFNPAAQTSFSLSEHCLTSHLTKLSIITFGKWRFSTHILFCYQKKVLIFFFFKTEQEHKSERAFDVSFWYLTESWYQKSVSEGFSVGCNLQPHH